MPKEGRNTFALTADGYTLKPGIVLSYEDAVLIGENAGLGSSRTGGIVYSKEECPVTGDMMVVEQNPIYRPFIDENKPLPPMLQFFTSSPGVIPKSGYTINLKTLKPTRNSQLQTEIPEYIRAKYQ
jgi:hypothetical protein